MSDKLITISSGDAKRIMKGDVVSLWMEKMGLQAPEDFTWKLPPQVGLATEDLNRRYYEHTRKRKVAHGKSAALRAAIEQHGNKCRHGWSPERQMAEVMCIHATRDWQTCHPDGAVEHDGILGVWDAKHTDAINEWNDAERVVRNNHWQAVHNMMVMDLPFFEFSIIYGSGNDFRTYRVERNLEDEATLLAAEVEFLNSLSKALPPAGEKIEVDVNVTKTGKGNWVKSYTEDDIRALPCANEFAASAADFLETADAAKRHDGAKKALKELVPEDAKEIFAFGLTIGRDARGSISVKAAKAPKAKKGKAA